MSFITENYEAIEKSLNQNHTYPRISINTRNIFISAPFTTCKRSESVVKYSIDANYGTSPYRIILIDSDSINNQYPTGILELNTLSPIFSSGIFLASREYIGRNMSFAVLDKNGLFGFSESLVVRMGKYPDCSRNWEVIGSMILIAILIVVFLTTSSTAKLFIHYYYPDETVHVAHVVTQEVVIEIEEEQEEVEEEEVQPLLKVESKEEAENIV